MADNLKNAPQTEPAPEKTDRELMIEMISLAKKFLEKEENSKRGKRTADAARRKQAETVDLVQLFYFLLSKIRIILLCAAAGCLLAGFFVLLRTPLEYSSTSKLYVANIKEEEGATNASLTMGTQLKWDYQELLSDWVVQERVIERIGDYTKTAGGTNPLGGTVSILALESSRVVRITGFSQDAQRAKDIAQAYAEVSVDYITETMKVERPVIAISARLAKAPYNHAARRRGFILGFLGGALLAAAYFTIIFIMDDRIKTQEEITELLDVPVLAVLPTDSSLRSSGAAKRRQEK